MIPKLSSIPTAMRWYLGSLCVLGLIPIALSIFYPLDRLNALLSRHIADQQRVLSFDDYKSMSMEKTTYKSTVTEPEPERQSTEPAPAATSEATPTSAPYEKTDWVGIIGGINSAVIAWFMYFDRRRHSRRYEEDETRPPVSKHKHDGDMGENDISG